MPPFITMTGGNALTAGRISCVAQISLAPMTVRTLGARISTASAGGNVQLAVYANAASTGQPTGTPLGATASMSTTGTGVISGAPTGGNFTLPAGVYWACVNADNSVVAIESGTNSLTYVTALIGSATQTNIASAGNLSGYWLTVNQTYGTWPDLTSAAFTINAASSIAAATVQLQAN